MFNDAVISRLKDIKFIGTIKNSTITIMSKKNDFDDIVKFYFQIDASDNIIKVSFKAKGCTAFMVACSYFCENIENKSLAEALKITDLDLNDILQFDESKKHVYDIILSTFALLVKKYRKCIEKGTIVPFNTNNVIKNNNVHKKDDKKDSSNIKIVNKKNTEINNDNKEEIENKNVYIDNSNDLVELNAKIEEVEGDKLANLDKNKAKTNHLNSLKSLVENKNNHDNLEKANDTEIKNNVSLNSNIKKSHESDGLKQNEEKVNQKKLSILSLLKNFSKK